MSKRVRSSDSGPSSHAAYSSTPLFLPDSRGPSPFAFNASAWPACEASMRTSLHGRPLDSIYDRTSHIAPVAKRARLEAPEDADCKQKRLDHYIKHFFDMAADDWESYDEELGDIVSYGYDMPNDAPLAFPSTVGILNVMPGEWIRLREEPYAGCIALVLTDRSCLVERLPVPLRNLLDLDVCDIVDYSTPLRRSEFPSFLPTSEEVAPFQRSRHLLLQRATFFGTSPSLTAGDRVVAMQGRFRLTTGYISILAHVPFTERVVTFAKVVDVIPDVVNRHDAGVIIPLGDLRRHAVEIPNPFRVSDRVRVAVGAEHRGCSGRVSAVLDDLVTVQVARNEATRCGLQVTTFQGTTTFQNKASYFVRDFWFRDLIEVFRGPFKDRKGFVISSRRGDRLHANDIRLMTVTVPGQHAISRTRWQLLGVHDFLGEDDDRLADDEFIHDPTGHRLSAQDYETGRRVSKILHASNGRRFEGIEIQVGWKGPWKGTRGVVISDRDDAARVKRLSSKTILDDWDLLDPRGIIVVVQKEGTNVRFEQPAELLLHVFTLIPLWQARFLPEAILRGKVHNRFLRRERQPETSRLPTPPPLSSMSPSAVAFLAGVGPSSPVPVNVPDTAPALFGETDGRWLCIPGLARKRVDVKVEGVADLNDRKFRTSATIRALEGRTGYLLLEKPVLERSLDSQKIDVYAVGKNGSKHGLAPKCIRPVRQTDSGTPITQVLVRVVIIGPDLDGDAGMLGRYAQTEPERPHDKGRDVVYVRLDTRLHDPAEFRLFHRNSLCRATNTTVSIQQTDFPATIFNLY
ncbi:hypothetical protein GGX14DRAFT_404492 [Mycena pura]|uniref:Uncharacterized protein n=1 Tax=Mycena pura TaxID=153505 RepID=A0AAD6UUK3_9AGAR|nr:hypothetical protein GGX14DRAFT_404492 [Mycena pura]